MLFVFLLQTSKTSPIRDSAPVLQIVIFSASLSNGNIAVAVRSSLFALCRECQLLKSDCPSFLPLELTPFLCLPAANEWQCHWALIVCLFAIEEPTTVNYKLHWFSIGILFTLFALWPGQFTSPVRRFHWRSNLICDTGLPFGGSKACKGSVWLFLSLQFSSISPIHSVFRSFSLSTNPY